MRGKHRARQAQGFRGIESIAMTAGTSTNASSYAIKGLRARKGRAARVAAREQRERARLDNQGRARGGGTRRCSALRMCCIRTEKKERRRQGSLAQKGAKGRAICLSGVEKKRGYLILSRPKGVQGHPAPFPSGVQKKEEDAIDRTCSVNKGKTDLIESIIANGRRGRGGLRISHDSCSAQGRSDPRHLATKRRGDFVVAAKP